MNPKTVLLTTTLTLAAATAFAANKSDVHTALDNAIIAIEDMGVENSVAHILEPANGMHDLENSGLHIWAINTSGVIVFDNSGQTQAGMDVSTIPLLADGTYVPDAVTQIAANPQEGITTSFPHPTSMEMGTAYVTCRDMPSDATLYVCGMAWGF